MTLPDGWELICVDELAGPKGIVSDGDWVESKDQDSTGGVRLTQLADVGVGDFRNRSARFMTDKAAKRLNCTYLVQGDVLIARMPDPIGRACVFPGLDRPAVTAVDVMIRRTDGSLARAEWLVGVLNSPDSRARMAAEAGGTTRQRIAGGRVKVLLLPTPPLAEQGRIVAKLGGLTARIARARAELVRVSHLAAQLRDQTLTNAVSGELTRDFRANADISWPEKRIEQIGTVITGSTPPTTERDRLFGGPYAFFKPTDLDAGYHVLVPRETLTEEGLRRSQSVPTGSTLVTCIGATISKTGFARVTCAFNQQINAIVPKVSAVPEWLFWAVSSPSFRSQIINNSSATTMPIINKGRFQQLTLAVPPIAEQREIVFRIEAAFARADRLEAEAARAAALLDRLEASILAKAFRGELVPQDPADEPASALLDRVRAERAASPKAKRGRRAALAASS